MKQMQQVLLATEQALRRVTQERFFQTERGYQGQFYFELQAAIDRYGLLGPTRVQDDYIVEMEYQKSARHGMAQRPDLVVHVPVEHHQGSVQDKNLAVFALKHQATAADADDDFMKLDEMIERLQYQVGIFINVASNFHLLERYRGPFMYQIHAFAVEQQAGEPVLHHAFFNDGEVVATTE